MNKDALWALASVHLLPVVKAAGKADSRANSKTFNS